jgi:ferredoxin
MTRDGSGTAAGPDSDGPASEGDGDHSVTVSHPDGTARLSVTHGTVLRNALLAAGLTPHSRAGRRLNCGGRGLCATCGVRVEDAPTPDHWHDDLAARFGYPRLSCQIRVTRDMEVTVPEKLVWGGRETDAK